MRRETKQKHGARPGNKSGDESGNAMIYVLIVIVLFGALAFVLARQRGGNETGQISTQSANTAAVQIIQLSNQIKQGVDQMMYGGTTMDQLNFCLPSDSCFSSGDAKIEVFSADGGGLIPPVLPAGAIAQIDSNPAPGWYLGSFNNVEWTDTPANDVVLTAHQLSQPVCARIDEILTGSATIPAAGTSLAKVLIDPSRHSQGTANLDTAVCPACNGHPALCVSNADASMFSYYNVIEQR